SRLELAEEGVGTPVRRRSAIAQEACRGEDERASADARHQRSLGLRVTEPFEDGFVRQFAPRSAAARIHEDVQLPGLRPGSIRKYAQALRAGDFFEALRD